MLGEHLDRVFGTAGVPPERPQLGDGAGHQQGDRGYGRPSGQARDPLPAEWRICYAKVDPPPATLLERYTSCDQAHQGETMLEFQVTDPKVVALASDLAKLKAYVDANGFSDTCTPDTADEPGRTHGQPAGCLHAGHRAAPDAAGVLLTFGVSCESRSEASTMSGWQRQGRLYPCQPPA